MSLWMWSPWYMNRISLIIVQVTTKERGSGRQPHWNWDAGFRDNRRSSFRREKTKYIFIKLQMSHQVTSCAYSYPQLVDQESSISILVSPHRLSPCQPVATCLLQNTSYKGKKENRFESYRFQSLSFIVLFSPQGFLKNSNSKANAHKPWHLPLFACSFGGPTVTSSFTGQV